MIEFDSDTGEAIRTPDIREAVIELLKTRLNSRVSPEAIRSVVSFGLDIPLGALAQADNPTGLVIKKLVNMRFTASSVLDDLIKEFTTLADAAERPQ